MSINKPVHINRLLIPISWLYGFVVYIRNLLFRKKILKQKKYDIPIICVGNISVGGTGKTPHTEYLIRLLKDKYKVAVLSRGYKRKTNGFILATQTSLSREIGDEPFQIKQKFPDVIVAVDRERTRGVEHLLNSLTPPDVIILDDGFQHRYLKPSYSIILSDYNRPMYEDVLLPAGRLREPMEYLKFASDIIVTKCPEDLSPLDKRIVAKNFSLLAFQHLFFTTFSYKKLQPVFDTASAESMDIKVLKNKNVLLVTGIANPQSFLNKIAEFTNKVELLQYKDHHSYSLGDIKDIFNKLGKVNKQVDENDQIIIVTEKDAVKLRSLDIDGSKKKYFYYIPIEVEFLDSESQKEFEERIISHVEKNRRDSALH